MKPDVSRLTPEQHAYWRGRKVLVLCLNGNSRSVGLAYILKDCLGADAIAAGVRANGSDVLARLAEWAQDVIVMDARLLARVPRIAASKTRLCDVGSDTYFRGVSDRLAAQCLTFL